jgi:hypothetical protein
MPNGPVRRAQLIAPFGVGALIVVREGISLIAAGLDHWYKREDGVLADTTEFMAEEWRLSRQLGVDNFRQPPDFRLPGSGFGQYVPNSNLTIPFLRFPQWHSCSNCSRLKKLPLSVRGKQICAACKTEGKYGVLTQVPIIAMCEKGHLQDFPWREWVHRQVNPTCQQPMRLVATGSATLAGQKVKCGCGQERSLSGVSFENVLSKVLEGEDNPYLCQGQRPWLGTEEREPCSLAPRATLRSASNVYYAQTASAIFIPRGGSDVPTELLSVLESPVLNLLISQLSTLLTPQILRNGKPEIAEMVAPFSDEQIRKGIEQVISRYSNQKAEPKKDADFRREEFNVLRSARNEQELKIRSYDIAEYADDITRIFSRITLIDKLRETRALYGFTRIVPETNQELKALKSLLRRNSSNASWLPAYVVYGEGIFLELNEDRLGAWLMANGSALKERLHPSIKRNAQERGKRELKGKPISERLFLVHTFAHLLIRRLTFECGYSAASLRERLYVADDPDAPMAALLIYTASGDAEGTMGGLVRMGKPGLLEPVIRKAIEGAQWCSSDPVCMELGDKAGHMGNNLAACHSCVLLPETACEEFNQFLDRAVCVGNMAQRSLGYFVEML